MYLIVNLKLFYTFFRPERTRSKGVWSRALVAQKLKQIPIKLTIYNYELGDERAGDPPDILQRLLLLRRDTNIFCMYRARKSLIVKSCKENRTNNIFGVARSIGLILRIDPQLLEALDGASFKFLIPSCAAPAINRPSSRCY